MWLGHGLVGFCDVPKTVKIETFGAATDLPTGMVDLLHYNKRYYMWFIIGLLSVLFQRTRKLH